MSTQKTSGRLPVLDYLRGYFIVVIIVDHLSRWPSVLGILSGKALLWVTAAEGFVIISGLLVGYVRGFKNRALPMKDVSGKLLRRAGILYLWSIIGTVFYTALLWYVPLMGGAPGLGVSTGDWWTVIVQVVTLEHTFVWVHFLTLYAIFLAASPIAVWLLRRGLAWAVVTISLIVLVIGWQTHIESLQWQALFFIPSVAGFYMDTIRNWWQSLTQSVRRSLAVAIIGITLATIIVSTYATFYPSYLAGSADWLNAWFAKDTIGIARLLMAFTWFTGFLLVFNYGKHWIGRWFGWLLLPIGTHSLTAYILHGLAICLISFLTVSGVSIVGNTVLGITAVLVTWGLLKIPLILRIVPS